jgi:hypothetical protein
MVLIQAIRSEQYSRLNDSLLRLVALNEAVWHSLIRITYFA